MLSFLITYASQIYFYKMKEKTKTEKNSDYTTVLHYFSP